MQLLRLFLRGLVAQLVIGCGFAKQAHLRQVHVVSVGEGKVDCDDIHGSDAAMRRIGCDEALRRPENGVLLVPESNNRWHAFNVHTLMLPQHGASVEDQSFASQSKLSISSEQEFLSQSKLDSVLSSLYMTRRSANGTLLLLGVIACLAFVFVQMFSNSLDKEGDQQYDNDYDDVVGSWARAYRDARGSRRVSMDMLFKSGIIPNQDMCRLDIATTHIEECIHIAEEMLQERSEKDWVDSWQQAQRSFEERRTAAYKAQAHDMMANFQFSDGSWARAYRQSEGDRERQEAFELLLRLGIISSDEFANGLVPPKLIEERLAVAMDLLKQKSLKEWVDLCETAHGRNFKESVLACFAVQSGPSPREPDQWNDEFIPPSMPTNPVPVERQYQRAKFEDSVDSLDNLPNTGTSTFTSAHQVGAQTEPTTSYRTIAQRQRSASPPANMPTSSLSLPRSNRSSPTKGKPVFVLPHSPRGEPLASTSTDDWMGSARPAASSGVRTVASWPMRPQSPRDVSSHGLPVKIMFSNNAISGSSWETSVTPPRTPPATERDPGS